MEQAKLNKILDNHELWLKTNGKEGERANLGSADLRYADLSFADLRCANLRCADLSSANLIFANLRYANLRSANLSSANLSSANLRCANLRHADLRCANLLSADLRSADMDCSAFPLWCGGLDVHIDDRQATQMLYHLIRNVRYSKNTSETMKKLFKIDELVKEANKFHRVMECGVLEVDGGAEDGK